MEIRKTTKKYTLTVRLTTPASKLSEAMGPRYQDIVNFGQQEGIHFAGPPFAIYHNMDMEALDVEIGFPVAEPVAGKHIIQPGTIPGGRALYTLHTGPYSQIEKSYEALMNYKEQHKLKTASFCYEVYLNDPATTPEEELTTEIYFPLQE